MNRALSDDDRRRADTFVDRDAADIAICGAGPVGAACALLLVEAGFPASRVALVGARTRDAAAADDRMIALAYGSATLLARLGVWRDRAEACATPIEAIHVSQRGRFGRTVITRDDYGVPALGYVIRYGDLATAFDAALEASGVAVARPLRVARVTQDADAFALELARPGENDAQDTTGEATMRTMRARYAVHAEGNSFDAQAERAVHRNYDQSAVTAFVVADGASDRLAYTAFERFTEAGPIALLPARQDQRFGYSLVWCGRPEEAEAHMALSDAQFLDALHTSFGDRLGRFTAVGMRRNFPLGLNAVAAVARASSPRSAEFAIGNAAQTLHPVAGQGLNLGLRDAFALATAMRDHFDDAHTLVATFTAARRIDRAATVGLTDFMPRVFASRLWPVVAARGGALALLDLFSPARNLMARQMMNGRR